MYLKLSILLLALVSSSALGFEDPKDYISAYQIQSALRTVTQESNDYDCNLIALAMLKQANPSEEIDPTSPQVKERMENVMRKAKYLALHTNEIKHVRLFNACLKQMGLFTIPTGQYLLLDSSADPQAYHELSNDSVRNYLTHPTLHEKPELFVDYLRETQIQASLNETAQIPYPYRCLELARSLIQQANPGEQVPIQPSRERIIRIFELALSTGVWNRKLIIVSPFQLCLEDLSVKLPSMRYFAWLTLNHYHIGPIELPEEHRRTVGDVTDLFLS